MFKIPSDGHKLILYPFTNTPTRLQRSASTYGSKSSIAKIILSMILYYSERYY